MGSLSRHGASYSSPRPELVSPLPKIDFVAGSDLTTMISFQETGFKCSRRIRALQHQIHDKELAEHTNRIGVQVI